VLVAIAVPAAAAAFAGGVHAQPVPDITASFTGPAPNPVPAGATATLSAQFTLTADLGEVTVSIELRGAGDQGTIALDATATTPELTDCTAAGPVITCSWDAQVADGAQTLAVSVEVDPLTPANTSWELFARVDDPATPDPPQELNRTQLFVAPSVGSTSLSGRVTTTNATPLGQACIFVLSPLAVFQAITDASGNWSIDGLPDDYLFAVAAVAPFTGSIGPCANEGPPPAPEPGELQPVFYDDIWIDLTDPDLVEGRVNAYDYAIARGAVSFADSTTGLDLCLTSAPGNVVPRPSCLQVPTTTTTSTVPTTTVAPTTAPATTDPATTTTTAAASTTTVAGTTTTVASTVTIAATGSSPASISLAALALIGLGLVALAVAGRRSSS
jgi:hypothetical protein